MKHATYSGIAKSRCCLFSELKFKHMFAQNVAGRKSRRWSQEMEIITSQPDVPQMLALTQLSW